MRRYKDLYSENSPPTEIADRICASLPNHFFTLLHQRVTKDIAEDDKYVSNSQSRADLG